LFRVIEITLRKIVKFSVKLKKTLHVLIYGVFFAFLILAFNHSNAQDFPNPSGKINKLDSVNRLPAKLGIRDTTVSRTDTIVAKGDIETTVKYSASDSILFSVDRQIVYLYGNAKINYGQIILEGAEIEINYETNILSAHPRIDSTGRMIGKPVFKDGVDRFETKEIKYNFKTRKAYISGVVTQNGDAYMHGEEVKKNQDDVLFINHGRYTTCNLAHPHYFISSRKLKIIPQDKIVSGPFNLVINDVPTPLGFPFGMFPSTHERKSGVIFPSYGEEVRRGFFLRNGGYFIAINDYINLALTSDFYTKGSFGINASSTYRKRYKYSGSFRFNHSTLKLGGEGNDSRSNDFRISWSHNPQNKGTGRFSVSVNAATSTFNQNNALDIQNNIRTTLNSSISYSKSFTGTPISMGLNGRFNQNLRTKEVNLLLPELSVNVQNIYPFRKKGKAASTWYEKLVFRYSLNGTNQINNRINSDSIAPFDLKTLPDLISVSKKGFKHTIPISTSVKVLKYFTLTPNLNYTERWYFEKLDYSFDPETKQIVTDTIDGFTRINDWSTGVSLTTRIYGTYFIRGKKIEAIRHLITPNLSFNYRPDFSDLKFGIFQEVQKNEEGDTEFRSRYRGFVFGAPGQGKSGSIGFGLTNNLEMKVRSKKDTAKTFIKIPLINNFSISSSYNLVAESFNLSTISWNGNTSLFNRKLNLNLSGNIDPYIYELNEPITIDDNGKRVVNQTRVEKFAWNNGRGIGQLTSITLSARTSLNPKAFATEDRVRQSTMREEEKEFIINNPDLYVDFNIPWNLSLGYSLSRTRIGFRDPTIRQTLRFSGNLSITEKTKIQFNSGYDIEKKEFTQTRFNISRNLHCWEMLFSWTPFGNFESFDFTIRVKSSMLQDLKLNRRRSFFDLR